MISGLKTTSPEHPGWRHLGALLWAGFRDRAGLTSHVLAALALILSTLPAQAFDLGTLMGQLALRGSGEARFTEQRFVSGLEQTLQSSGHLSFQAPDKLARHTVLPRAESFVVEGNRLVLERGGRVRQMALDSVPEIAAIVAALRGTLSGDSTVLHQHFRPSLSGQAGQWTLTLVPLDERLAGVITQLRLGGSRADLLTVEVLLADGDRSLMKIEPLAAGKGRAASP